MLAKLNMEDVAKKLDQIEILSSHFQSEKGQKNDNQFERLTSKSE